MSGVTVERWGDDLAVRLPDDVVRAIGIHEGDNVEVTVLKGAVVLRPTLSEADRRDMAAAAEELLREGRGVDFGEPIRALIEEGRR